MRLFAGAGGLATGFVGAIIEAWAQLRIGKLRVLLSLVGVAVAVAAMAFVIAVGQISVSAINSQIEQYGGRSGTVTINVSPTGKDVTASGQGDSTGSDGSEDAGSGESGSGASGAAQAGSGQGSGQTGSGADGAAPSKTTSAATSDRVSTALASFVSRYEASSWATSYTTKVRFAFPDGPRQVSTQAVSLGYGTLHHTPVAQGRWFSGDDADDLSPTLVVSQGFLENLGVSELTEPITITSYTPVRTTFTIVGVLKPDENASSPYCTTTNADGDDIPCPQPLSAFVLADSYEQQLSEQTERPIPTLEIWAGKDEAKQVKELAKRNLDAQFGKGSTQVSDNLAISNAGVSADAFTTVVTGAGVFIMILGALSLVNISLVTVRQRIHEIGVRRSFGATSRRIFFSIMLESVVATVVAGVVGVGMAIVALRMVPLSSVLGIPTASNPPFPMVAAIIGLLAATGVGALSGIIPAIVAVRIRPIDAIRY
ncbi:ABC transporter permease [Actinomyces israelii]|uniref:ABC transporter permease n=1 Tax=Actinomyces israelii TaxID=1659 RepID=UPI0005B97655|nr:ABC transporter permease [Actinomyces israelii]